MLINELFTVKPDTSNIVHDCFSISGQVRWWNKPARLAVSSESPHLSLCVCVCVWCFVTQLST